VDSGSGSVVVVRMMGMGKEAGAVAQLPPSLLPQTGALHPYMDYPDSIAHYNFCKHMFRKFFWWGEIALWGQFANRRYFD